MEASALLEEHSFFDDLNSQNTILGSIAHVNNAHTSKKYKFLDNKKYTLCAVIQLSTCFCVITVP